VHLGKQDRVLHTLRYTLGITFWYLEDYDIQQPFGPRGAKYHRFYCREKGFFSPTEFRKAIGLTILSYSMGTVGSFPGDKAAGAQRCWCWLIVIL